MLIGQLWVRTMFQQTVTSEKILKVQADKRRAERVKSAFSGAISSESGFICHCVIKDVSNTGMRLSVPKGTELPEEFYVKTPAVPDLLEVQQQWQKGDNFGVTFKIAPLSDAS